jgi:hypothetical protein
LIRIFHQVKEEEEEEEEEDFHLFQFGNESDGWFFMRIYPHNNAHQHACHFQELLATLAFKHSRTQSKFKPEFGFHPLVALHYTGLQFLNFFPLLSFAYSLL